MITCAATYIAGYSTALDCERLAGHNGPHRDHCGTTWDD